MKLVASLAAAMLMLAPAAAQTGDKLAALAAARDLLVSVGFEQQMERTSLTMANAFFDQGMTSAEEKVGESMPTDLKQQIRSVMNEEVASIVTELKRTALDDAAQIYAEYFSADELRRLTEINTDPVMRKMQALTPQLAPQLAQIGLSVATKRRPALEQKIKDVIEQWTAAKKQKGSKS